MRDDVRMVDVMSLGLSVIQQDQDAQVAVCRSCPSSY